MCHRQSRPQPVLYDLPIEQVNFEAVGKLETFREDEEYIIRSSGIADTISPESAAAGKVWNAGRIKSKADDEDKVRKYFSQLSLEQKRALERIYRIDFEMFGYSAKEYL